jgi:hypothetical protein
MSRFIVIDEQGQHVTLGAYAPTAAEIESLDALYVDSGVGAWVAEMAGVYYSRRKLTLTARRTLGTPTTSWDAAVAVFLSIRKERNR